MHGNRNGLVCQFLSLRRYWPKVFIEAYIDYYQRHDLQVPDAAIDSAPWLRIATDNKGLIEQLTSEIQTKIAFAGAALCAEYDVVHATVEIEGRLPFRLKWEHVKGHQDDKKKWYELTWMETLNVRADKLQPDWKSKVHGRLLLL
jgi:hypothetical protein